VNKKATPLIAALVGLVGFQAFWDTTQVKPKYTKKFMPKNVGMQAGLSPDQLLFALSGFREMIAGILWVRADTFFDSGNYDAILPIIRLVTWLDPNQIDVYATGMWHIGYNFTDEQSRSDRRYIPSALALGKEGAANNPNTYEMFFETGWMYYHKVDDDYSQAAKWFGLANEKPDILPARRNLLATAMIRNGDVEGALDRYYKLYDDSVELLKKFPEEYQFRSGRDTIEQNLDNLLVRMSQRGYFGKKNNLPPPPIPYDTDPPFDTGFGVKITVPEPKVIRFEGTWNVRPVGTRIRVILRDADYPSAVPGGMKWDLGEGVKLDPPKDITFMQDQLYVRNQRFDRTCDLAKDPTMYPMKGKEYVIEFYYNPRSAPPHIQDKFSWSGEGMTDKNFLNTEIREGQRVVFHSMKISRDQLLRRGQYAINGGELPILKTDNYVDAGARGSEELIEIPTLRAPSVAPTGSDSR
jgi:TPR repeat protein